MAAFLSPEDVKGLLTDPSAGSRAQTAEKVAKVFDAEALSPRERALAEDIFRIMVHDAEVRVREALANNLKTNPMVPHDVAVDLARDVASVALPVLEFSEVLTDGDLVEIIRAQDPDKQVAIASRRTVSETVSEALVDTRNESAVSRLVQNPGAEISEGSLGRVLHEMGNNEVVLKALSERPRVPVAIAERLVTLVSENLQARLSTRADLSPDAITDLILQIRERAVLSISSDGDSHALEALVRQLKAKGRLTPSISLRALCMGDIAFFEVAMAEMAGIPVENARELIHDAGPLGLRAIFRQTGLPKGFFPGVRAAIDVARDMEYDGGEHDRERYARRMMERILTQYGDLGVELEEDDLEYLLTRMNSLPIDAAEGWDE